MGDMVTACDRGNPGLLEENEVYKKYLSSLNLIFKGIIYF